MKKYTAVLVAIILVFSSYSAFAAFKDIDESTLAWAGDAINSLTDLGVINGYEDGTFRPSAGVTRAEFAKLVAVAFELKGNNTDYDDVPADYWAKDYISNVSDVMYTEGKSFEPEKKATRADIAYCVASILDLELQDKDFAEKYSDYSDIPSAMQNKVAASAENGIMIGYEDMTLRPLSDVSRAEAAVIVYRALNFKADVPQEPEIPSEPQNPGNPQKPEDTKDHIYTLYPGKDIILLISVNKTVDDANGEDAYKLTYKLSGSETEYSSVIPWDTPVVGIKTDISQLSAGDILVMNTAFHGYIGNLYVFASFGGGSFNSDHTVTGYGKGDYTLASGKIKELKQTAKNTVVTLEAGGTENTVYIPNGLETEVFSPWKKGNKWSYGNINDVAPELETEYAFIRCTNGIATDVIVSDFNR